MQGTTAKDTRHAVTRLYPTDCSDDKLTSVPSAQQPLCPPNREYYAKRERIGAFRLGGGKGWMGTHTHPRRRPWDHLMPYRRRR